MALTGEQVQTIFSVPTFPRSELPKILSEYQIIDISESDLITPTSDFVSNLFSSLLRHIDSSDDPSQVEFEALEPFENPDMHADSVRCLNLYFKVHVFLRTVACPLTFTLGDLVRPDASRTHTFICAFLNFFFHRDSKLSLLEPYIEGLSAIDEQRKEKEAQNAQLREEIARLQEAKEMEKPLALEAEAKVKELQQTIDNLNNLQSNLRKERQSMKDKALEMQTQVSKTEYELIQATEQNAMLRSQIVHSPDKLQRVLEEKKAFLAEAKESERFAMQNFHEKTAKLEIYTKALEKMTKQSAQMQAIQEQVNSFKAVEKDVKQLKAKLSDEQMLDISLEAKIVEYQAKAEKLDEQKSHLEKEANLKREEATKSFNKVKVEAESRSHDLEMQEKKIQAIRTEADATKAKIESRKTSHASSLQQLLISSEEIMNEMILYFSSLKVSMKELESLSAEELVLLVDSLT